MPDPVFPKSFQLSHQPESQVWIPRELLNSGPNSVLCVARDAAKLFQEYSYKTTA
jgi:hypothetical protein